MQVASVKSYGRLRKIMVTTDQLFALQARQNEVFKRVKNGGLSVEAALAATQGTLDGIYPTQPVYAPPSWYVSPEQQLERVRQLNAEHGWGFADADFPAIPSVTLHGTEVLLLAVGLPDKGKVSGVQRTFDEHVAVIRQQLEGSSRSFWQWDGLKSDPQHLQLQSRVHETGLTWVVYDYAAHHDPKKGHIVKDLWKPCSVELAASEVLSALVLFPEYGPSMDGDKTPYANLPGYQVLYDSDWSRCPYVDWWSGDRRLYLGASWADNRYCGYASPVVREC